MDHAYIREIALIGPTFVEFPRQIKATKVDGEVRDEDDEDGG